MGSRAFAFAWEGRVHVCGRIVFADPRVWGCAVCLRGARRAMLCCAVAGRCAGECWRVLGRRMLGWLARGAWWVVLVWTLRWLGTAFCVGFAPSCIGRAGPALTTRRPAAEC